MKHIRAFTLGFVSIGFIILMLAIAFIGGCACPTDANGKIAQGKQVPVAIFTLGAGYQVFAFTDPGNGNVVYIASRSGRPAGVTAIPNKF